MARLYTVAVPKASVHEDRRAVLAHHDVGFSRHALHVETVAVAVFPQPLPHALLRRGVFAADARHAIVPLLGCHDVGHRISLLRFEDPSENRTDSRIRYPCYYGIYLARSVSYLFLQSFIFDFFVQKYIFIDCKNTIIIGDYIHDGTNMIVKTKPLFSRFLCQERYCALL